MSDNKKLSREELAAALEDKAKALRENRIPDEDVERMSSACGCCHTCTFVSQCGDPPPWTNHACDHSCIRSSPN